MEKSKLNIKAVYSFLTNGSVEPVTTQTNPPTGPCFLEQSFVLPKGLMYMCIGVIFGWGPFVHYEGCKLSKDGCPLKQYAPTNKIDIGPFKIEQKWAAIKANGK